jgi:F-type H+-transporting ATPase subunit gamma
VETLYRRGEVGSVIAVYAEFLGGIQSRTLREQILPLPPPAILLAGVPPLTEPEPERLLDRMLTRYLRSALYQAAVNGAASEHSARVRAMTAATDNAEEMIVGLRRQYNKARQAAITKEIAEIAGAAEALR